MEKYTLNLDSNNYVLSIAHTKNDSIALDLSKYDLANLSCYQYINGELVLDTEKLAEIEALKEKDKLLQEKAKLEAWLSAHDYIGVKIATKRATVEEYANEIAEMTEKAERINKINDLLESL